jgi:hypothetical protein
MAIVSNTVTTYAGSKSIREELSNVIYNIAPTDTPFMSNVKREMVDQPHYEWQTDTLAAASTTGQVIEGDDTPAVDTFNATNRVGNYAEIRRKVIMVSRTEQKAKKAGIADMLGYQVSQGSKEIKRHMEATLLSDSVAVVGNATTARKTAGLGSWIVTNFYSVAGAAGTAPIMSSGSDGYPATAAVDGATAIAFTEAHLRTMISNVWTQGGDIEGSMVMVGPVNKAKVSQFTGIATRYRDVAPGKQASIVGAADMYVGDFGTVSIVPNRFMPENRTYLVDPDMASVAYFDPFKVETLAKTGDAIKRMLIVEYGLKVKNEKAFGTVRGILTT